MFVFDRFVVAMKNGDLDGKGPLASIIQSEGTIESFKVRFLPTMYKSFTSKALAESSFKCLIYS